MRFELRLLLLVLSLWFAPLQAFAQDEGLDKLDEATSLKAEANNPTKLAKVIELCEQAIKAGLDSDNLQLAKQILSDSALQRAKMVLQQLPRVANNAQSVQRLRTQALRDVEKAIESNPKSPEAHMLNARLQALPGGDADKAIESIDKAIGLLNDKPKEKSAAYILRAAIQPELDDKLADLQKAIQADPSNTEAWQARVVILMGTQKFEEAYKDVERLLERDQSNSFALTAAFESLLQLKRFDDIVRILTPRIEAAPDNGALYRMRGQAYLLKSDSDEASGEKALADLDKAVELDPRDAQAMLIRGEYYFDKGEVDNANKNVNEALSIEPGLVRGVLMRSMIAAREKRYTDAINDMELIVRANPNNDQIVMQLASYYQLDNRPRLAISALNELIKKNALNWRALRMRGDARLSISEHAEAIRDYQKAITAIQREESKSPGDEEDEIGLLNNLAWVLATSTNDEVRDGKRSVELGLKACEKSEYKQAHILSTLAAGYAEIGNFEEAMKWSTKAVEVGTEEQNEQLEQLKKELENYKEKKPWREAQEVKENKKPLGAASNAVET